MNDQPLKFDTDKVRLELLPPEFLISVAQVLTFGAKKYTAGNWATGDGFTWSRLYGAILRHLMAWASGEDKDPESGLSHLGHAGCMLAFLIAHVERKHGKDDRVAVGLSFPPMLVADLSQQDFAEYMTGTGKFGGEYMTARRLPKGKACGRCHGDGYCFCGGGET